MNIPRFLSERIFKSLLLESSKSFSFYIYNYTRETLILNSTIYEKPAIESKTCFTILGMIPAFSVIASPIAPYIV